MSEYDPTDLLVLCDSILEDGEISGDEAYELAQWLNDHHEARHNWPGEALFLLLQQIWADGKVTKTELRQLGRMLIRIRKESVKRLTEQTTKHAFLRAEEVLEAFDHSTARLPLIPWVTQIKSQSEKGLRYDVDLSLPACSCPDFMSKRQGFPLGHLNRCCKHVFDAYRKILPMDYCPGWLGAFIDNGWPPHPQCDWWVLPMAPGYVLASTAPTGWANVYTSQDDEAERYGYNVVERRWSYGEEPKEGNYIAGVIHRVCGNRQD